MIRVVSLSPELPLASAPATQGVTIIPNSALSHCEDNEKMRYFLALYHEQRLANCFAKRLREPWENASESRLRRLPSAFFQDANYHDQIVKEQNEPAVHQAPSARDPVASRKTPITGHILGHRHGQRFVPNTRSEPQPTARSRPKRRFQYETTNHTVQWHRLALRRKLAEPRGSVKHHEKYRKNKQRTLGPVALPA